MPQKIIKASAGSGKTFQLSNEFLNLIFRSGHERTHERIGSILASTFTRKAAGEILDRILTRLADAALDEKKQKEFAEFVSLPDKSKTERTKLLQKTTADIAKNLYRLRISTLDSFFNKIASSCALELALPPGWTIIDDTEYQRSIHEAVQEVFAESHKNEARKLLHLLQKGEQDRSVTREIIDLAEKYLPLVRSTDAKVWDHSGIDKLGKLTQEKMSGESLQQHIAPVMNDPAMRWSILPKNAAAKKNEEPQLDKSFASALDKFLRVVNEQDWDTLLTKGFGKNIILGMKKYGKKNMEQPLLDFLLPCVLHAKALLLETVIHQTMATRVLLDLVWEKLQSILVRKRGFRFEDITLRLGDVFEKTPEALPLPMLSHRIDAHTKHLLLDEFQDTSMPQWNILQPFVRSVSQDKNNTFFCVGDLKQAIYSWRGGVAEIFETVSGFLEKENPPVSRSAAPLTAHVMNETRRNSQPVIDVVNQIFTTIGDNTAVRKISPVAAQKWQGWFGTALHETKEKGEGYCVLEAAPVEETSERDNEKEEIENEESDKEEPADTETPFWKYTLDRIQQIHQKHPHRSIGILFRAARDIPTVIKGLKSRKIEASDEGGIPLTDSAAVQHVLSVMTLVDHPGNTIVRYHLAKGPLAEILPLRDYADHYAAEKTAHRWREKLLSQGYGKTVKELMEHLTPCEPKEMQRLEKLLELAYRFDGQAVGTRTRQFVETVNAARMASPSAASVRLMTIHGAKGLEFDVVVLPDLDGKLVGQTPKIIVSKEAPNKPVDFVLRYVSKGVQSLLPEPYPNAFTQWKDNQVKESLAVLYVAMTRARYELVMIVPEKSKKGTGTYGGVLRAGLQSEGAGIAPPSLLYQTGNADWDNKTSVEKESFPSIVWNALAKKTLPRNLPRTTPSGMEAASSRQHAFSEPAMPGLRHDASLRGTAIHACFSYVRWIDDTEFNADTLQKLVEQAIAGKQDSINPSEIVKEFRAICGLSEVRKILSRSYYPEKDVVVENERRFSVHWNGKILRGLMDRLVIRRRGDEVVGLDIIDFKTDQPVGSEEDFIAERQENYKPQLEAYRHAAEKLYPNVINVSTKLVFTSINRVVVVE